jgi:tetratricopeptide (TPR) repeat protein
MSNKIHLELSSTATELIVEEQLKLGRLFSLTASDLYRIAEVGYQKLASGNLEEAKKIYAGLVAADPDDSVFNCHLATVYHRLEDLDQSLAYYTRSIELNRKNVDALVGRGQLYLKRGEVEEAIKDFQSAVEIDPEGSKPSVLRAVTILLQLKALTNQTKLDGI